MRPAVSMALFQEPNMLALLSDISFSSLLAGVLPSSFADFCIAKIISSFIYLKRPVLPHDIEQ